MPRYCPRACFESASVKTTIATPWPGTKAVLGGLVGETGVLFSGSRLCTFNDDCCSQLLAGCCTAQRVPSRTEPLLPSSGTKTAGRDTPPLCRAARLPGNVTLRWPGTTRSRRCHSQLGRVCFVPRRTLSQLAESSSPGWGETWAKRFVESLGRKGWSAFCCSAWGDREGCAGLQPGSATAPGGFFSSSSHFSPFFPFLLSQSPIFNYLSTRWMG